jgi:hypothetical protein
VDKSYSIKSGAEEQERVEGPKYCHTGCFGSWFVFFSFHVLFDIKKCLVHSRFFEILIIL